MLKINFIKEELVGPRTKCPMCGSEDSKPLLKIDQPEGLNEDLVMRQCLSCETGFFVNEIPVIEHDHESFENHYWFNHIQNGADISAMLEPIFSLDKPRTGNLLDIGCGFGFVPHFWETMTANEAVGLEVSQYGKIGSEKLGSNIIPKYYSETDEIRGRKFQYVFSHDVIEHVESPKDFLLEISTALAEDGILILTTPSSTALNPATDCYSLIATLSPGFHFFIASAQSLRSLLMEVGFEYVEIHDSGHRLFAWASHRPLPKIKVGFNEWPLYLNYLDRLSGNSDFHVAGGALYQALKVSFNLGDYDRAEHFYSRLKLLALENYGLDFDAIDRSAQSLRFSDTLNNKVFPSWLGCGLLYAALIEEKVGSTVQKQLALLSMSIEVMQKEIELGFQFASEPAHFIQTAKEKHQEVYEKAASVELFALDPNQTYILRHPGILHKQDVCLFAAYSSRTTLTKSVVDYIEQLEKNDVKVILCLAIDDPTIKFDFSNISSSVGIVIRKNGGYDFCAWSSAIRLLPEIWDTQRIFFTNDSVFAMANIFKEFMEKIRSVEADFVSLTDSYQIQHHSQSYFTMIQGAALSSEGFRDYLSFVPLLGSKKSIIKEYEISMLSKVKDDFRLKAHIMFPLEKLFPDADLKDICGLNVTHTYWDYLVLRGLPFVKVELIHSNPTGTKTLHWPFIFEKYGASVKSALEHLATPRVVIQNTNHSYVLSLQKGYLQMVLRRLSFHKSGRPRDWLRKLLLENQNDRIC